MMPTDFLVFLNSQKKLDSALLTWNPHRNKDDYSTEVQQCPFLKENVKIPVITSFDEKKVILCSVIALNDSAESDVCSSIKDSEDSENEFDYNSDSEYSECEDKEDCHCDVNNPTVMKCEEEDVLFFVLEEKYLENSLMFHHLQGNDRILADLLRCCPVIDVHLAKVTHTNTRHIKLFGPCSYPETTSTNIATISRLIDADGVVKDLHIDELNWNEKCVGPRNWLESPRIQPDKEIKIMKRYCRKTCRCWRLIQIRKRIYFNAILIILPKHQSIGMYCRYGLGMFLNFLESSLTSALAHQQLAQDLYKTVEYCCSYPQRIWTQSTFRNGELTLRLLRLCNAKKVSRY
jgi:hypothetical protein